MTPAEKHALDVCQNQQKQQADEMQRLACRIAELEKQVTELKGQHHNGN
jgi:hypothetical protein